VKYDANSAVANMNSSFDFTNHIRRLCEDMVSRTEPLQHIDMERVAISFSQTRSPTKTGIYASLTPLRFPGGTSHTIRRGRKWEIQKVIDTNGRSMLYLMNFYLPRFLDLNFHEKLETVIHELWHVSPRFDGDLRRLGERKYAHGASLKKYDDHVRTIVDHWLSLGPPERVYSFLREDFRKLMAQHGKVIGTKIRAPKMVRVD
jgi:predicted metallopeptidase